MGGRKTTGFTIVELIIVIAVIAILVSIVLVTYKGVQDNANDKAVQSDLRNIAEKMEEFRLTNRRYPQATQAELQGILKFSKGSYITNTDAGAVSYCRNDSDYTIMGRSASKAAFVFSSKSGLQAPTFNGNLIAECAFGGITPSDSGYAAIWLLKGNLNLDGPGWQPWIN